MWNLVENVVKKKVNLNNFISAIFEKLDFFFSGIIIILNEC